MAKYQRIQVVEARQYDGPGRLPVISDSLGEQQALPGDWLLGSERGKITVKTAEAFVSEGWLPYSATPQDDELTADKEALATLKAELAAEQAKSTELQGKVDALTTGNQALLAEKSDADALKAQVADLSAKLATAEAQKSADEAKLDELTAQLTAFTDAQAKLDAAKAAVQKALE